MKHRFGERLPKNIGSYVQDGNKINIKQNSIINSSLALI